MFQRKVASVQGLFKKPSTAIKLTVPALVSCLLASCSSTNKPVNPSLNSSNGFGGSNHPGMPSNFGSPLIWKSDSELRAQELWNKVDLDGNPLKKAKLPKQ